MDDDELNEFAYARMLNWPDGEMSGWVVIVEYCWWGDVGVGVVRGWVDVVVGRNVIIWGEKNER